MAKLPQTDIHIIFHTGHTSITRVRTGRAKTAAGSNGSVAVGQRLVPGLRARYQPAGRLVSVPAGFATVQKIVAGSQGMLTGRAKAVMGADTT